MTGVYFFRKICERNVMKWRWGGGGAGSLMLRGLHMKILIKIYTLRNSAQADPNTSLVYYHTSKIAQLKML
jgi:hypothetical protein